jgi:hypothetical protein
MYVHGNVEQYMMKEADMLNKAVLHLNFYLNFKPGSTERWLLLLLLAVAAAVR